MLNSSSTILLSSINSFILSIDLLIYWYFRRIRDKYGNEIKELELSEQNLHEKCSTMKERVEEMENICIRLKSAAKQKEQEVIDMKKLSDRLQEERGKVSDIIRQEFADRWVLEVT